MEKFYCKKIKSLTPDFKKIIEGIFWVTSGKKESDFSSKESRDDFVNAYLNFYLDKGEVFISTLDGEIVGYILLHHNTSQLLTNPIIKNNYQAFNEELKSYPVSLHINISPNVQGKGVGSRLLKHALNFRSSLNKVHLITHHKARNVEFYSRLGFQKLKVDQNGLLFLGIDD
jgi:GNAT superfamily N-acetyltransferase